MQPNRKPSVDIFYGWWVVCVLVVVEMMVYGGGLYAFTLFMKPLETEFGWSRSLTSGSVSMFWVTAPLVPIIGLAVERVQARWLIVAGVLLVGVCFLAVAQIQSAWELYALRGTMGLGKVIIAVAIPVIIARWFDRRAGIALGVAYSGSHFGGAVLSPITQLLITHLGWRSAAECLGVVIPLVIVLPTIWVLRFERPSVLGLQRDGTAPPAVSWHQESMRGGFTVREVLRNRTFWILMGLTLVFYSAYASILTQESAYLIDLGFDPQLAATAVGITAVLAIASVLIYGFAIDRGRPRAVLLTTFSILVSAIGVLLWLGQHANHVALIVFAGLFGFAVGGIDVVFVNTVRRCFGDRHFGAIYGCWYFLVLIIFVVVPIATGHVYDVTHSYVIAFGLAEAGAVVGLIVLASIRLRSFEEASGSGHDEGGVSAPEVAGESG